MMTVGIDPGISGAIAIINGTGTLLCVEDMPIMAKGKGGSRVKSQVNAAGLAELLGRYAPWRPVVYCERVSSMPDQGVASVFSLGDTFGCIRGVIGALGLASEIITPQSWKKYYGVGSDKEVARAKAIEMYPLAPIHKKKDHNRAEAILIARYGLDNSQR